MDEARLIDQLRETFPLIGSARENLSVYETIEMFRKYVQRSVYAHDCTHVAECFAFAAQGYVSGDAKVKILLDAAFVEELDFNAAHGHDWAWHLLPPVLQQLYCDFHGQIGR